MHRFYQMVEASNKRFPNGVEPFQMATRLLEECGEIASEINLWEDSGVKRQKHGDPKKENIANEIRQAMVELVKIACYLIRSRWLMPSAFYTYIFLVIVR